MSKKTKYSYGVLPSELNVKIKSGKFKFERGPCKFPYVEEGSVTEKKKCFSDKASGLDLCPTKLHKNKSIKRVGLCFDLNKMKCQIPDSPHSPKSSKSSKKSKKSNKTKGWCHPYDKPTIKSPPSKSLSVNNKYVILRQETGFAPYHTNGDGNCLFHSMVGSILMNDDLGEGFLDDNIRRIEDENGIELKGKNYAEKMRSLYIHILNNTDDLTPFYFRIFSSVIYDGSYARAAHKVKKLIKPEYIQELIDKQKAQGWIEPHEANKVASSKSKKAKKYKKVLRNVPGELTRFVIENEDKDDCQYEININYNGANHYEAMGAFSQKEKYKPTHKAEKSVESSNSSNSSNSYHSSSSSEVQPPMTTIGNNPDEYLFKIASHYNDLEKEDDRSKPEYDLSANDLMILNRMKDEFLKIFVNPYVYTDEHMARTVCSYLKINMKMHQISQLKRYVKERIKKPSSVKKDKKKSVSKKKRRRKGSMNSNSSPSSS